MLPRPPEANVLNRLLWLGKGNADDSFPVGSGVIFYHNNKQYLATALHVAESCDFRPSVRFSGQWNSIDWRTVATSPDHDIAILETTFTLDSQKISVLYGEPEGLVFGQIGYAVGYPGFQDGSGLSINHIIEVHGRPVPMVALVVANFSAGGTSTYSASYINAGFSGGAIVFPMPDNDWTIAGIITHFPTVPRPVYRDGKETQDVVMQHAGLVGYVTFGVVEDLIEKAQVNPASP